MDDQNERETGTKEAKEEDEKTEEYIRFTDVGPHSVRLEWGDPKEDAHRRQRFKINWKNDEKHFSRTTDARHFEIKHLSPGRCYIIKVVVIEGDVKKNFSASVVTVIPAPEAFEYILEEPTTVKLQWNPPLKIDGSLYKLKVVMYKDEEETESVIMRSDMKEVYLEDLIPATEYKAAIHTVLNNGKESEPAVLIIHTRKLEDLQTKQEENVPVNNVLQSTIKLPTKAPAKITQPTNVQMQPVLMDLGLYQYHLKDKLTLMSVLELKKPSDEDNTTHLSSLPSRFLNKLMMVNSTARNIKSESKCNSEQRPLDIHVASVAQEEINPLDLITALFHCTDPFLQQEITLKMSLCQFSVPLLLPNCDIKECTLMLWAMRDITKQFRSHSLEEHSIVETELPLISFVRLGKSSMSKSEFLNKLLSNNQHDTFIHKNMENGDIPRKISNGLVEMSWYLPSGRQPIDRFKEPIAVANLRGDISHFEPQFSFLSQTSSAVYLFCDDLDSNQTFLNSLQLRTKLILVCAVNEQTSSDDLKQSLAKLKVKPFAELIRDTSMNDAKFIEALHKSIVDLLGDSTKISIEQMSKVAPELGILVDENNPICQNAKKRADLITQGITSVPDFKVMEHPLQGKPWKEISRLDKELCRLKAHKQNIEHYKSELKSQIQKLRKQQTSNNIRETTSQFMSGLSSSRTEQLYFLKWMKFNLDCLTRKHQSRVDELGDDKERANSSLGVQHFMRELSQLYEATESQKNKKNALLKKLPETCAQLMLNGFPLELVDGDASNIPLKWIGDVLKALNKLTAPKNRIRVVTVLGIQSTGKSTLLNTMFGVQFAVSSGRCTRGAFMLLISVSKEFQSELQCDYILIIDTEGLKSQELANTSNSYEHDNELATLVVGLSDVTIVNISMENAAEIKDTLQVVVHAFLRMKEVGKRPCCHFVHQNTADVAVHEKIMREKKMFLQQLDEMTQAAAKMEKVSKNRKFTDILEYNVHENNWYIAGLWLGTPPMAPVSTGYSEDVSKLKNGILCILKAVKNPAQNFMEFEEWIRSLWKAVQFENFIFSFRNSLVAEAYSRLCMEFNTWEWAFKKHMIEWHTKSETKISNMGVMSVRSRNSFDVMSVMANIKEDAADELNKEEEALLTKIQQYFESEEEHVNLVENYKEEFVNCAKGLRRETETDLRNRLENAVMIQKGIEKVELIKQSHRDNMKEKVLDLITVCRNTKKQLSESQLKMEFQKMWDSTVRQHSLTALPRQDLGKETYRLLHKNLERKGGAVRQMLSDITSLEQCGTAPFYATTVRMNSFKKFWNSVVPSQRNKKHKHIQQACDQVISESTKFISLKTNSKSDYNSADIQELLCLIDKHLESCSDPQINPEIEAALKMHICGNAARAFQKMHDDYLLCADPLRSLEKFREQWFGDFKDLYNERDQCQKKAETCAMQCFAPSVMEYIQKLLGPDIVEEMLTGERAVDFCTRSFFQFSLLKQLLQDDDFNQIHEYVVNYETFVTKWISDRIVKQFSKDDAFLKLEMKHLHTILNKIKETIGAQREAVRSDKKATVYSFVASVFESLDKELVLPSDSLSATQTLSKCNLTEFADCLKTSLDTMQCSLTDKLRAESDVQAKLAKLSVNKPQNELFKRVFGCGKMCPFCLAPCEAGGKEHSNHFLSIHRPQGIGNVSWVADNKLIADICSSLVASDKVFRHENTAYEWYPFKDYRQFFPEWSIQPDSSIEATDYWKYIFAKFNDQFAEKFNRNPADIPDDWQNISVDDAYKCLEDTFKMKR
ncbi:hypothetical protein DNTS_032028 [Danionella cerebrum]|uniref:Interferon-induced very large GTPase 1-like n=1 Tax=Danionella cerebrum TaxID=2873325 RepID=A0A553P9I0_9TELE|nr:hypothetical protein DNTS_032028 [Danionella translucida]